MNSSALAVETKDLTVQFDHFTAVDRISFTVKQGEIFGFLGANGAGKTTTIRVLCGLLVPTSGSVRVAGLDFKKDGPLAIKAKVGYMSQKFTLYDDMTVAENLAFAGALRKIPAPTQKQTLEKLLNFISFQRPLDTLVRDLPGGIKQQVSLVTALLHDPEIIFLDEPTAGVTPAARSRFWSLIRELVKNGKTVFVTTHYLDEAENCDRIALMADGKIVALDSPAALKETTFPEALYEIDPLQKAPSDWIEELKNIPYLGVPKAHGVRLHVTVQDTNAWQEFAKTHSSWFHTQEIQPSLEDVFIRVIEGARS